MLVHPASSKQFTTISSIAKHTKGGASVCCSTMAESRLLPGCCSCSGVCCCEDCCIPSKMEPFLAFLVKVCLSSGGLQCGAHLKFSCTNGYRSGGAVAFLPSCPRYR